MKNFINQIDVEIAKSIVYNNWKSVVILILGLFLFKSCQEDKESKLLNAGYKIQVKELKASADKYVAKNNALNDTITLLEKKKQKVKTEIVYIQNKTKSDIKKVPTLNTKQIANYYQQRYKLPVTITQYGVSLSDTIAKKNIVELIQKDGCFEEIKKVNSELKIEEEKGVVKDSINKNLSIAISELDKAISTQDKVIDNVEKSLRKERTKKTVWQVATGAAIIGAGYLLIAK